MDWIDTFCMAFSLVLLSFASRWDQSSALYRFVKGGDGGRTHVRNTQGKKSSI